MVYASSMPTLCTPTEVGALLPRSASTANVSGIEDFGGQGDTYTVDIADRPPVGDATAGGIGAGLGTPGREGSPAGSMIVGVSASADQGGAGWSDCPGDDGQVREGGQEPLEEPDRPALPGSVFEVSDRDSHEGPLTVGRRSLT